VVAPVVLRADNFTPPSRTPWGGRRIVTRYKSGLGLASVHEVVGESWEISVEPSFPSRLAQGDELLGDVIGRAPRAWLGARDAAQFGDQTPLLVKLLDAADDLSVQVHPADDDAALGSRESGKPEAWVVLEADAGAGLYLGFRDGVGRAEVEACIAGGGALDQLMNFTPVATGDAFVIEAGTPHAIGRGLTLLEPQRVLPGRHGLTYRFWDWNRRYDAAGRLDPRGSARELHLGRSLAVTRWDGPAGDAFVEACRARPQALAGGGLRHDRVVDWRWFSVERFQGSGSLELAGSERLLAVVCVAGTLRLEGASGVLTLRGGESGVVPAAAAALRVDGSDVLAFITATAV
jgi:mannose-6-phosphate isomerase